MNAQDEAVALFATALIRKAGSPAAARSVLQLLDDYPEMSVDEAVATFKRGQEEDVR